MSGEKEALEAEANPVGFEPSMESESTGSVDAETSQTVSAVEELIEDAIDQASEQIEAEEPKAELTVIQLMAQLNESKQQAEQEAEKALRIQAEMENLRRRTEKDLSNAHKFALEKFSGELLAVMDSLELGIQSAHNEEADVTQLREGNELTLKQLQNVFEKFDIIAIDPEEEPFDPELHQAMSMQPTDEVKPNTVLQVFQKGYILNKRLIRPAMVVVSQAMPKQG